MEGLGLTSDFWRHKRVLVTGHTGFKGSWLCLFLHRLGSRLSGYALAPAEPSLFCDAGVANDMQDVCGDVGDVEALIACVRQTSPEIIFHLAAQSLVRRSYEQPLETYRTNVSGTVSLLEAVRATHGVRAVVIVTSDKCYDLSASRERYCEEDALGGADPYSSSKAAAEHVAAAYRASYFSVDPDAVRIATARSGNVIGGGDWSRDRLLPDLIAGFSAGKPALIRNPNAVRPWQHVLDPLRGYLMLAERLWGPDGARFARAWNFGPPRTNEWTVAAVAQEATACFGDGAVWQVDERPHPHEAPALRLDSGKAAKLLQWRARIPLPVAIRRTIEWHKQHGAGKSARCLVNADIEALANSQVHA